MPSLTLRFSHEQFADEIQTSIRRMREALAMQRRDGEDAPISEQEDVARDMDFATWEMEQEIDRLTTIHKHTVRSEGVVELTVAEFDALFRRVHF